MSLQSTSGLTFRSGDVPILTNRDHSSCDLEDTQRFTTLYPFEINAEWHIVAAYDSLLNNGHVCIASIARDESTEEWLCTKLLAHCRLNHPHVLKYYDVFLSETQIHVIFEHPHGENLLSFLSRRKLTEQTARNLFQQLVFIVDYMHRMGLNGTDLTLESIFIDVESNIVQIADFGYRRKTTSGTVLPIPYASPEMLQHPKHNQAFHKAADVWSLGVLLYSLLFGSFPFTSTSNPSPQTHIENIINVNWNVPPAAKLSHACWDLLHKIFTSNLKKRLSLNEIMDHPWYLENLPVGVSSYQEVNRPRDGLAEKVQMITITMH